MYSQTKLCAITDVGVSPNETQALVGKSISLTPPPSPSLGYHHSYFVLDALSPNSHSPHFKQKAP